MRRLTRAGLVVGLIALGYVLGARGVLVEPAAQAQLAQNEQGADPWSETAKERVKSAYEALIGAQTTLQQDGMYRPAVKVLNSFAVSVGGVDAIQDLETTQTVDPETFAALYSGQATDEVAEHLAPDDLGRLMYKGKVIRIYPISRIRQLLVIRRMLGGLDAEAAALPNQ